MTNRRTKLTAVLLALLAALLCLGLFVLPATAHADSGEETAPETRGIYTRLALSIKGENGEIIATVTNVFTLGSSTVKVRVELYSSTYYEEDYTKMTLRSGASIGDLNIFKTIDTSCPTNGEPLYWVARMRYKCDDEPWEETCTGPNKFNGNGEVVE